MDFDEQICFNLGNSDSFKKNLENPKYFIQFEALTRKVKNRD